MPRDDQDEWENKANNLDITKFFVQSCNNDEICKDLERMITFSKDKYPQEVELACNIYHTQYFKTEKSTSNNRNEGNEKGQDKNYDNSNNKNETKDLLISEHISRDSDETMDSVASNLVAHASNSDMWVTTEGNKISSLVEEDIVCYHLISPPLD